MQAHLRILLAEAAEQPGKPSVQGAADIAHLQAAALPGSGFTGALQRLFGLLQRHARFHQQGLSGHGQAQGTVAAHDQFTSELVFQPSYRRRQRRLRHVPAGGRFGQLDTPAFLAMNPHGKVHPPLQHVRAWYDQLQARPAYRQHVMVPFGELRGRLEF
ncbi:hypothetical protein G6F32_014135 [Rhizopus arrhizus]|nr:hypothetical protein G6F32_014135 [Rhizopus arrhizus]